MLEWEIANVTWHDTPDPLGPSLVGSTSNLAIQHRLGLLPERGTGFGSRRSADSCRYRTNVTRKVLVTCENFLRSENDETRMASAHIDCTDARLGGFEPG